MFRSFLYAPGTLIGGFQWWLRVPRHNDNLPEDVLLEIFDTYRQQPDCETVWNSRDGWLKLAHVCLHWRRVVFSFSSRLHVHLLFTPCKSSRSWEPVLRGLPHFPVIFDYSTTSWEKEKEDSFANAVIRRRSRVRAIALRRPCPLRVLEALTYPFPELERLEIEFDLPSSQPPYEFPFPSALLSGSAPSLRRLKLQDVALEHLSPLLSYATGLEELSLWLWISYDTPRALLVENLQRMSCLRRLELKIEMRYHTTTVFPVVYPNPPPPVIAEDVVPLSRLTDFIFTGPDFYLKILATRLAAPSLQRLDTGYPDKDSDATFPLPQLFKFISDSECQFKAVRLGLSIWCICLSAQTCSKSDHAQSFTIGIPSTMSIPWEHIGHSLSTVEEIVVTVGSEVPKFILGQYSHFHWRALFNHTPQVRTVQVHYQVALGVAHAFQVLPDGQGPALDLLPFLEQVEVHSPHTMLESFRTGRYATIHDAFEPLIAMRQRVGRPIKVHLSQD